MSQGVCSQITYKSPKIKQTIKVEPLDQEAGQCHTFVVLFSECPLWPRLVDVSPHPMDSLSTHLSTRAARGPARGTGDAVMRQRAPACVVFTLSWGDDVTKPGVSTGSSRL